MPVPVNAENPNPARQLQIRKRWLFRIISVALAVAPFAIAEVYLRFTTKPDDQDLSSDPIFDTSAHRPLFTLTDDAQRMEISASRSNFFRPAAFEVNKPAETRRVFVLGGSTVQGRPYETETAFAKWLQLRLQASDSQHQYDVINCGGISYASYRLAIVLDEVLRYKPDAIVIYCGHNEFLEERSYHTLELETSVWSQLARSSQLVQAIRRTFSAPASRPQLKEQLTTRLDFHDGMELYRRDLNWRTAVAKHFQLTLQRMVKRCVDQDVPLVLCFPASDVVNTAPLKTESLPMDSQTRDRFETHYNIARDAMRSESERLNACDVCLEIDQEHAGVHFIAGSIHWGNQRSLKAREHLFAARDLDVCPLRAPTPILRILLDTATQFDLDLIRCDRLLDQADSLLRPIPDGIPDPQRFVDHIHPTIGGHQQIGEALAKRLVTLFEIDPLPDAQSRYEKLSRDHLESLDESYFNRAKQRLQGLRRWATGRAGRLSIELDL